MTGLIYDVVSVRIHTVSACLRLCMFAFVHVCVCACFCVCECVCVCVYARASVCVYACVSGYARMCVHMCVSVSVVCMHASERACERARFFFSAHVDALALMA